MRRRYLVAVLAATAMISAACNGGDSLPAGVLQPDDLSNVSNQTERIDVPRRAVCGELSDAELRLGRASGKDDKDPWTGDLVEYTLDDGDTVDSGIWPPSTRSADELMSGIRGAIADCVTRSSSDSSVASLEGLDAGWIGYRYTEPGEHIVSERVFALKGDRIVAVGVEHRGAGEPSVEAADLMPKALKRAKDAPKE